MICNELKNLAEAHHLKIENEVAYGMVNECFITLCSGVGYQRMYIYAGAAQTAEGEVLNSAKGIAEKIAELAEDFDTYHIINDRHNLPGERRMNGIALKNGGSLVQVNFYGDKRTFECIETFMDDILPRVAAMTDFDACMKCAQDNNDDTVPVLVLGEAVVPMHKECAESYIAEVKAQEKMPRVRGGNNFTGIIGAFLGAMVGTVVWTVVGVMGYIAGLVGWLTAFLAGKGFDLLGGKSVKVKITAVIVLVIISILLGTGLTMVYALHDVYVTQTEGMRQWQLALIPTEEEFIRETMVEMIKDPEMISAIAKDVGIGLFLAGIACITLIRDMNTKSKPQTVILKG